MSVYNIEVSVGGRTGQLRIEITDLPGKENWQCMPAEIIGTHRGQVAWKEEQLGLFSDGAFLWRPEKGYFEGTPGAIAYALMEVPPDGLDVVDAGEGGEIRIGSSGVGQWVMKSKLLRP